MFDYQAGEKYKMTLIMVGIAGLIAGMFFAMLLTPSNDLPPSKRRAMMMTRAMSDPDITGHASYSSHVDRSAMPQDSGAGAAAAGTVELVDKGQAAQLMASWLPRVWDLDARTAAANQESAISYMTQDCAAEYRRNIWTADTAAAVANSGLQSEFHYRLTDVSNLADGSAVVKVQGEQVLKAPAGQKTKVVNLEYMLKQTPAGVRIAGISEVGKGVLQ